MCFGVVSSRTAALIVPLIQFISAIYLLICMISYSFFDKRGNWKYIEVIRLLIFCIINLFMSLILALGVTNKNVRCIKIWICWQAASLVLSIITLPYLAFKPHFYDNSSFIFTELIASFLLNCVFLGVVYIYYEEIVLEKNESAPGTLQFQKEVSKEGDNGIEKVAITSIV